MPFSFTEEQRQTIAWLPSGLSLLLLMILLGPVLTPFIAALLIPARNPDANRLASRRIGLRPPVAAFAPRASDRPFGSAGVLRAPPASAARSVAPNHFRINYLRSSFFNPS